MHEVNKRVKLVIRQQVDRHRHDCLPLTEPRFVCGNHFDNTAAKKSYEDWQKKKRDDLEEREVRDPNTDRTPRWKSYSR